MKSLLSYCDELQHEIKNFLNKSTRFKVVKLKWDLHPKEGYMLSTKKFLTLKDEVHGKRYNITIEEVNDEC